MKTYEAMFIFSDRFSDEELDAVIKSARSEIEGLSGEVISSTRLGRRQFARPIKKNDHGHYAVMNFKIEPEHIPSIHSKFKLSDSVLRVQIVIAEAVPAPVEAETE
jgi:small subunit ribosomal protein S6